MSKFDIDRIRQLKSQGIKVKEICKIFGCHPATVWNYARDIPSAHAYNDHMDLETINAIKELRASGMTIKAVAEKVGVCQATVWRHTSLLPRERTRTAATKRATHARWRKAVEWRDGGMSIDQIALRMGCKRESVPVMLCRYRYMGDN